MHIGVYLPNATMTNKPMTVSSSFYFAEELAQISSIGVNDKNNMDSLTPGIGPLVYCSTLLI